MSIPELLRSHSPRSPIPLVSIGIKPENEIEYGDLIHHQKDITFDELPKGTRNEQLTDESIISDALTRIDINTQTPGVQTPVTCTSFFGTYESLKSRASDEFLMSETIGETNMEELQNVEKDYQSTPKSKGDPQACLFVASLAASRTDAQLVDSVTEHFEKWGPLLNVKVLKDWMLRPYSFVQFENVEHAHKAMLEAQNTVIDGRYIRIEHARVNRTLFITRFSLSTTEKDISAVMEKFGPVEDVTIFNNLGVFKNKRHAFSKFVYRDDAISAYTSLQSGSKWTVEWAPNLPCQKQIDKESIYIGQLNPRLVTEIALREHFQRHGNIKYLNLIKKDTPVSKVSIAFAFIEYDNEASAKAAVECEDNSIFLEMTIRVQHRETKEYRIQRHNAAMQATQHLDKPRFYYGLPPYGLPTQRPNCQGAFQPYPPPYAAGSMYYTTYYTYPSPSLPISGVSFVPMPELDTACVQGRVDTLEHISGSRANMDRFAARKEFNHGRVREESYTMDTPLLSKYTSNTRKSPSRGRSRDQTRMSDSLASQPLTENPSFRSKRSNQSQYIRNGQTQANNGGSHINRISPGSQGISHMTPSGYA
ncbi:hypothetical protein BGZ76_011368 [Entomortierella beljakovae]|nr:hypothetical protein BGZ76_011368 [Entomortierella beljakovae]